MLSDYSTVGRICNTTYLPDYSPDIMDSQQTSVAAAASVAAVVGTTVATQTSFEDENEEIVRMTKELEMRRAILETKRQVYANQNPTTPKNSQSPRSKKADKEKDVLTKSRSASGLTSKVGRALFKTSASDGSSSASVSPPAAISPEGFAKSFKRRSSVDKLNCSSSSKNNLYQDFVELSPPRSPSPNQDVVLQFLPPKTPVITSTAAGTPNAIPQQFLQHNRDMVGSNAVSKRMSVKLSKRAHQPISSVEQLPPLMNSAAALSNGDVPTTTSKVTDGNGRTALLPTNRQNYSHLVNAAENNDSNNNTGDGPPRRQCEIRFSVYNKYLMDNLVPVVKSLENCVELLSKRVGGGGFPSNEFHHQPQPQYYPGPPPPRKINSPQPSPHSQQHQLQPVSQSSVAASPPSPHFTSSNSSRSSKEFGELKTLVLTLSETVDNIQKTQTGYHSSIDETNKKVDNLVECVKTLQQQQAATTGTIAQKQPPLPLTPTTSAISRTTVTSTIEHNHQLSDAAVAAPAVNSVSGEVPNWALSLRSHQRNQTEKMNAFATLLEKMNSSVDLIYMQEAEDFIVLRDMVVTLAERMSDMGQNIRTFLESIEMGEEEEDEEEEERN